VENRDGGCWCCANFCFRVVGLTVMGCARGRCFERSDLNGRKLHMQLVAPASRGVRTQAGFIAEYAVRR